MNLAENFDLYLDFVILWVIYAVAVIGVSMLYIWGTIKRSPWERWIGFMYKWLAVLFTVLFVWGVMLLGIAIRGFYAGGTYG